MSSDSRLEAIQRQFLDGTWSQIFDDGVWAAILAGVLLVAVLVARGRLT